MKKQEDVAPSNVKQVRFEKGELYLFHPTDASCPPDTSLWGCVLESDKSHILLETSCDAELRHFVLNGLLPCDYRFCRLSTRDELRDYAFALALCERYRFSGL